MIHRFVGTWPGLAARCRVSGAITTRFGSNSDPMRNVVSKACGANLVIMMASEVAGLAVVLISMGQNNPITRFSRPQVLHRIVDLRHRKSLGDNMNC